MATAYCTPKSARPRQAQPARQHPLPNFSICERSGKYVARRPLTGEQIIKAALKLLESRLFRDREPLTSVELAGRFLAAHFAGYEREAFGVLFLNHRHQPIAFEELFHGTVGAAWVYPREIVKAALRHNATAAMLAHNHPSGSLAPSDADRHITREVVKTLALIEVTTLDHFIIGGGRFLSFAEMGLMGEAEIPHDSPAAIPLIQPPDKPASQDGPQGAESPLPTQPPQPPLRAS